MINIMKSENCVNYRSGLCNSDKDYCILDIKGFCVNYKEKK